MQEALTPEEMARCVTHLRPLVEAGQGTWRDALAYLWPVSPAFSRPNPRLQPTRHKPRAADASGVRRHRFGNGDSGCLAIE
jgi:hypothetical protein